MSGHSKWANIKHKKGAADAKRGKVFTQVTKIITIAAKGGGDPAMNATLAAAIVKAKTVNLPAANIERAIKNGTGENKDAVNFLALTYEGRGIGGVAFMINVLTDNKNRTVSDIRSILTKAGGSLGENGSVAYMFDQKGIITTSNNSLNGDDLELAMIDAGAEEIEDLEDDGKFIVYTQPVDLARVAGILAENGFTNDDVKLGQKPNMTVKIDDVKKAQQVLALIDKLEENEDVDELFSNFEFSAEVEQQLLNLE